MIRKTLTSSCIVGLLLSVGLWARSYRWIDTLLIPTSRPDQFEASSMLGVIHIGLSYDSRKAPVTEVLYIPSDVQEYERNIQMMRTVFRDAGINPNKPFRWNNSTITARGVTFRNKLLSFPHWVLALLFSIPSFLGAVKALRRRKRKKLGLCVKCGYNLKGLTELRCPECGTQFEKCSARP